MAFQSTGLKTHIWNNRLASGFMLACYPLLVLLLVYIGCVGVVYIEARGKKPDIGSPYLWHQGWEHLLQAAPFVIAAVITWYVIATFLHRRIINAVTHAQPVTRVDQPKLYALLEHLCIARGLPVPQLAIIETPALNAFASGLSPSSAQVTVTRGLLGTLNEAELEAVLAHELSHIINRDIELLVISAVFVGLFSFLYEVSWRSLRYRGGNDKKGGQIVLMVVALASVGYLLSIVLKFALSRKREYLADAGAVELTRNPDAMVSALEAIDGKSAMPQIPTDFKEMMIDFPRQGFFGMFSTHPPISHRIAVLRSFAGAGVDVSPRTLKPKRSPWEKRRDVWR